MAPQLAEELLQVRKRDTLAFGDSSQCHRPVTRPHCKIDNLQ